MRVIMTGFTALQRGPARRPNGVQKIDVPAAIVEALRGAGHEVDWRPVKLGEDLERYDVAWVNLARPISMNSRVGALGSLWTLTSGLPCVGFYDDWQAPLTVQGDCTIMTKRPRFVQKMIVDPKELRDRASAAAGEKIAATWYRREDADRAAERVRAALSDPRELKRVRVYRFYEEDDDLVERWMPHLDRTVEAMMTGERWRAGMVPVCPMYQWGDRGIVQRILPEGSLPLVALDPSEVIAPLLRDAPRVREHEKRREWLLSALMPAESFVKNTTLTWPLHNTGSQTLIKRLGRGERLKTEAEVLRRYAERWGVLSPPYDHAGSGWWRSRFLYAATVGSVVAADPREVAPLGDAYAVTIPEIERLTTPELRRLAEAQAGALLSLAAPEGELLRAAETAITRAQAGDTWYRTWSPGVVSGG